VLLRPQSVPFPTPSQPSSSTGGFARRLRSQLHHQLRTHPLWHAAPIPHHEDQMHAHALTSLVLFRDDGTVAKIYAPGYIPRLLYWLAFQAPFPYMHNPAALEAAQLRRNLAGMLTEYWYGSNRVARVLNIEHDESGRFAVVSERIQGDAPTDPKRARQFLFDLADRFDEVGLPSWQIDPRQPRSIGNVIERADGRLMIIDLESGLVSPLASPRAWWRAIRRGSVPLFDEVYFDLTRSYIDQEQTKMTATLGTQWVTDLCRTLDAAEAAEQRWHESEPRIWRRFLRWFWAAIGRTIPTATPSSFPPQSAADPDAVGASEG
jgi:hypothetical protein